MFMSNLGKNLRRRAEELGLSAAEVARRVGISPRRYANYVASLREPDMDTFIRICRILKSSPSELLDFPRLSESEERLFKLLIVNTITHGPHLSAKQVATTVFRLYSGIVSGELSPHEVPKLVKYQTPAEDEIDDALHL